MAFLWGMNVTDAQMKADKQIMLMLSTTPSNN